MITFIATIGGRDIKISDKLKAHLLESNPEIFDKRKNEPFARKLGEFLLKDNNIENYFEEITIPILLPALKKVFDIEGKKSQINQIFLIVTNQNDSQFRNTDTIEYGKVIKLLLQKESFCNTHKLNIQNINSPIQINSGVVYLDVQFDFFQTKFSNSGDYFTAIMTKSDKIYLCAQGGIDAINTALLLNTLNSFGDKVIPLNVNEGNSYVTPVKIYSKLSFNEKVKTAIALIKRYDYNSLIEFTEFNNNFRSLAQYAATRLNFDFSSARNYLDEIDNTYSNLKAKLTEEINIEQNEKKLTAELVHNAEVKFIQGAYVDFLLRFFRIMEQIGKFSLKDNFKGFNWSEHKWAESFSNLLEEKGNEPLKNFCDNEFISTEKRLIPVNFFVTNPNIAIYTSLSKYLAQKKKDMNYLPYKILEKGQVLTWVRNKSIGAHNFEPVSRQIIENSLKEKDITVEELMKMIKAYFNINESPYNRINDNLMKFIKL